MKETPGQKDRIDRLLPGRSSADGFLGDDARGLADILREDAAVLDRRGTTPQALAERMRALTEAGKAGLGRPVILDGRLSVTVADVMGTIPCPFGDGFRTTKQVTEVTDTVRGRTMRWSDLNIHMIGEHGFFEGLGSPFRVDPESLVEFLR